MVTTMGTTMAEPVAQSRQLASAQAQPSANGNAQANGSAGEFESPEARFYVEQLSVQEREILNDLLRNYGDQTVLKLDLPDAWRAYVHGTANARGKDWYQGRATYDRRGTVDHLTERWLSAVRQLALHQILIAEKKPKPRRLSELPPARTPRIAEESPASSFDDINADLLELAERLADEAHALARSYPTDESGSLPPCEVLAAAGFLREATAGRSEGWLAALWRYVRTGSLEPAPPPPAGSKIRIRLVGPDEAPIDDLLPLEEAAEYLGVSRSRVSQLVQDGTLTRYPLNERCNLVAKRDLDRYADSARRHMKRGL